MLRVYLAIGAVATVALAALAATSTDGAIARLGSRGWNRLHRFVYASVSKYGGKNKHVDSRRLPVFGPGCRCQQIGS
jgi:hypothetical protein